MGGRWAWALVGAAAVIPAGAVVAVVLASPSDAGLLTVSARVGDSGRSADAGSSSDRQPAGVVRIGSRDGRLSFVAPPGWLFGPCPQGGDSCVEIAPKRLGSGDAIDVLVSAAAPGDSTAGVGTRAEAVGAAAGTALTVDGRPAVRLDLGSNASVLVYGSMPARGERFMISCRYDAEEDLVRQGCEQVTRSLTLAVS